MNILEWARSEGVVITLTLFGSEVGVELNCYRMEKMANSPRSILTLGRNIPDALNNLSNIISGKEIRHGFVHTLTKVPVLEPIRDKVYELNDNLQWEEKV
jgi:hypothetical protein